VWGRCLIAIAFACAGCGGPSGESADGGGGDASGASMPDLSQPGAPMSPARRFASKLGRDHLLIGMGNDGTNSGDDPAYHLGATLDLHYHYLVGLSTEGGWPTWNANPDYAGKRIAEAQAHGQAPMLSYYCMVAHGENNLPGSVGDITYMTTYYKDFIQLLDTIRAADVPVVLHVEPDFWGYGQQAAIDAGGVDKIPAKVSASGAAECASLPETLAGFGKCIIALTRARAPKALLGFHASGWGSKMDIDQNTDPQLDVTQEAAKSVAFFKSVGADGLDFLATDVSDRDAGCYEVGYTDAMGNVICGQRSNVYWDESNAKLPHFHQQLAWATALAQGSGLPILWWQVPFGVPSPTAGGTPGHFRDNRVHYMFAHLAEYVAAGGVGIAFGTGAGGQTFIDGDMMEFQNAVTAYFSAPLSLP
jgi:hypothetical protein